jgi:RNA polymerase sigma-70 factor, ECF subfamily
MQGVQEWCVVNEFENSVQAVTPFREAGQAGDRATLERLLTQHEPSLSVLCRGILGHAEDAEDAVQETFLRALRALPNYRGDASLRTWLSRIAVHVCLDWKRARRPTRSWSELPEASVPEDRSPETTVLHRLRISEAMGALMPRHRAVFLLKELEGWSVAEIAGAFRCTQRRIYHELSLAHHALADWRRRSTEGE